MNDVNGATKPPVRPANDEIPYAWLLRYNTTICWIERAY